MVKFLTDSIEMSDLATYDNQMALFVMFGYNKWHYGRFVDKGVNRVSIEKKIIKIKPQEPKRVILDQANLVKLGGPFEKIGDEDESVGGPNQKVGSNNRK